MNNTSSWLGLQALGGRSYAQRAIEAWIKTKDGKNSEEWCRNNWHRIQKEIFPEARLEGEWWRYGSDPGQNTRRFAFNEDGWVLSDHGDPEIKVKGIIPMLMYCRGPETLDLLALVAEKSEVLNINIGTMMPLTEKDQEGEGWIYRDYDGTGLYKKIRKDTARGKEFRIYGSTCAHWKKGEGAAERVEGKVMGLAKMVKDLLPLYGQEKVAQRWNELKGICIVEGEKTCDRLQEFFDKNGVEGWVSLTPGSSGAYGKVDTMVIDTVIGGGKDVVIWPDNDNVGIKAAQILQKRGRGIGSTRVWEKVREGEWDDGWDAADIENDEEFLAVWEKVLEESETHVEAVRNANTLEVPSHGYVYIEDSGSFFNMRRMREVAPTDMDRTLGEYKVKNPPSERFVNDPEERVPFVHNKYGFNHMEGPLYRDLGGDVHINRFRPIEHREWSREEISDAELYEHVQWFTDHMGYIFEDEATCEKAMQWLAHNVQKPGVKITHAILLQGIQSTGKSWITHMMMKILGKNCIVTKPDSIVGRWNSFFAEKSLVIVEELAKSNNKGKADREFSNAVKHLITGATVEVEEKYRSKEMEINNHVNFMFITNYEDSIQIDEAENRFLVHFSKAKPLENGEGRKLYDKLKDPEEVEMLYTWLMRYDLTGFDPDSRAESTESAALLKFDHLDDWIAYLEYMISQAREPFVEGHSDVHVANAHEALQFKVGPNKCPSFAKIRHHLEKMHGYQRTDKRSFHLLTGRSAKIAGISEGAEEAIDIEKLLERIQGRSVMGTELTDLIEEIYPDAKPILVRKALRLKGWENVVKRVNGRPAKVWKKTS